MTSTSTTALLVPTVSADVYMADKSNNDFQSFKIVVFMNISIPKIRSTGYVGTAGFDAEIYPYSTKNSYSFLTIECLPPPSVVLVDVWKSVEMCMLAYLQVQYTKTLWLCSSVRLSSNIRVSYHFALFAFGVFILRAFCIWCFYTKFSTSRRT